MNTVIPTYTIVYFNAPYISNQWISEINDSISINWKLPTSWQQLAKCIEEGATYIAVHVDTIDMGILTIKDFVSTITTVARAVSSSTNLHIGVMIRDTTPRASIRDLQLAGAQGILLDVSSFGKEEVAASLNALVNGITYWPKGIISRLPSEIVKAYLPNSIVLTTRQQQVFQLLKVRGLSNKAIANTLGISESTVKLHMSGIFKKYGVHSRTQLAIFAK